MTPRVAPLSILRRASWAIALALAGLAGCQPGTAPPAQAPAAAASPASDPVTTASASDAPLAVASLDSNLEGEDTGAIQSALNTDQVVAYIPSDLIHDGGVILFRTLALPAKAAAATDVSPFDEGTGVPTTAPGANAWKRTEEQTGGRQLRLRKLPNADDGTRRADVIVRYPMSGTFYFAQAARGTRSVLRKAFRETYERQFEFRLKNNTWQLAALSPVRIESQGGSSGLELGDVTLTPDGATAPVLQVAALDRRIAPDDVPTLQAGTTVRVEVAAKRRGGSPVFAYAHLVGGASKSKHLLLDNGLGGDRLAGDGVYSGTLTVPQTPGLHHVAVDVLDPAVFAPGGLYRSIAAGFSFRVLKPAAVPGQPSAAPSAPASSAPPSP